MPSPPAHAPRPIAAVVLALALTVVAALPTWAQEGAPQAPEAPIPTPVPLSEIGARAEKGRAELERLRRDAESSANLDEIAAAVATLGDDLAEREKALGARLERAAAVDAMVELDREWLALRAQLETFQNQLQSLAETLDAGLVDIVHRQEVWALTRDSARERSAPAVVLQAIRDFRRELDETAGVLERLRNRSLEIQRRVLAMRERVAGARQQIAATQQQLLANLLSRDQLPLWQAGPGEEGAVQIAQLLLLFPALILVAPLTARDLRPAVLLLGGFYVIDQLRDIIDALPVVARMLFTVEMLAATAGSVWLLRRSGGSAPSDSPRTRAVIPVLLRTAVGLFAFAALCSILGFQRLGRLLGDGMLGSAYVAILLYASTQTVQAVLGFALRSRSLRWLRSVSRNADALDRGLEVGLGLLALAFWAGITLELFGLRESLADGTARVLEAELGLGTLSFSLGDVLAFLVTVGFAFAFARGLEKLLEADVYPRLGTARGTAYAFSTILRYTIVLVGFLVAVGAIGFDMDRLTVLLGAFGVGLGFGMQTVINNFVSGLILLFERPIQIGDAIEVDGVAGSVHRIGIRASVVRTFDGAEVSVPNGNLLSQRLTNWTMSDRHRRIEIPVGVAYGSDPSQVLELLAGCATDHTEILTDPAPVALFVGFGDSSLDFLLRAWVKDSDDWVRVRSEIVLEIHRCLYEQGIEIPFPQRDLHVRTIAAPVAGQGAPPVREAATP